jgi:hypothetical protein
MAQARPLFDHPISARQQPLGKFDAPCTSRAVVLDVTRDVSGFLLIRDGGEWRIAGQAWDLETPDKGIPADLAGCSLSGAENASDIRLLWGGWRGRAMRARSSRCPCPSSSTVTT